MGPGDEARHPGGRNMWARGRTSGSISPRWVRIGGNGAVGWLDAWTGWRLHVGDDVPSGALRLNAYGRPPPSTATTAS